MVKNKAFRVILVSVGLFILTTLLCACKIDPKQEHVHEYGEWMTIKDATCAEPGTKERYCSCGEKQSMDIPVVAHTPGAWVIDTKATNTQTGSKHQECAVCGVPIAAAVIPVSYLDNLGTYDFGGEVIRFVSCDGNVMIEAPDNMTQGDRTSAAVYARQTEIEKRFNVTFGGASADIATKSWDDAISEIDRSITAGADEYDIGSVHMKSGAYLATSGMMRNLNKLTLIDFTQDYWSQSINDTFKYKTTQYWATGDIFTGYLSNLVGMYVDDTLFQEYTNLTIEELYNLVLSGRWTLEKLEEFDCIYEDTNNDGGPSEGDTFGWVYDNSGWVKSAAMIAAGFNYSEKSGSKYELSLVSAENEAIYAFAKEVLNFCALAESNPVKEFIEGRAMFTHCDVGRLLNSDFYNRDADFSVIVMPKYAVENDYRSPANEGLSIMGVLGTVPGSRYEMVGAIVEAMAAAGQKYVTEAYFEVALKSKYVTGAKPYQCLHLVRKTGYADFVFCWSGVLDDIDTFLDNCIAANADNLIGFVQASRNDYQGVPTDLYYTLYKLEKADKAKAD